MSVPEVTITKKTMPCPVCSKDMRICSDGALFCGHIMLIAETTDHYISISNSREILTKTGCPICGEEMENIGIFKWILGKEEGLERVLCNKLGENPHYICVSKKWYEQNRQLKVTI